MSTEERRLAAIVFTDIVGFTELMEGNEKSNSAFKSLLNLCKDGDGLFPQRQDTINRLAKLKKPS